MVVDKGTLGPPRLDFCGRQLRLYEIVRRRASGGFDVAMVGSTTSPHSAIAVSKLKNQFDHFKLYLLLTGSFIALRRWTLKSCRLYLLSEATLRLL